MDDLYADVPADFIYKGEYDLPASMTEQQIRDYFEALIRTRDMRRATSAAFGKPETLKLFVAEWQKFWNRR